MANYHDAYRQGASQNLAYNGSAGASAASAAFGAQTYWIRVCTVGVVAAGTVTGVRVVVGDGTPTATATSTLLPMNWVEIIQVTPGQKIAALADGTTAGSLNITELS